jgi:hypothetical protein
MASEIVHITFEKLTGLKGTFEGTFECMSLSPVKEGDVIVLRYLLEDDYGVIFSNGDVDFALLFLMFENNRMDYIRHFVIGRNFLISRLCSYGRGAESGYNKNASQSPN